MVVMLAAAISGWLILGFSEAVERFSGEETNCTANRGDAYQRCVRNGDIVGLTAHAIVIGLAMVGVVVAFRSWRRPRATQDRDPMERYVRWAATLLIVVSITLWVDGSLGGWEPNRPFPYEPVATSQGNAIMLTGSLVGLLLGAAFPLGRGSSGAADDSATSGR